MSRDVINQRVSAFMEGIKRTAESGTSFNWPILSDQLHNLFDQTYRDGRESEAEFAKMKNRENKMLSEALDKLLAMGEERQQTRAKEVRLDLLQKLKSEIVELFLNVVIDSFDPSKRKLDLIEEKFNEKLEELKEEIQTDNNDGLNGLNLDGP